MIISLLVVIIPSAMNEKEYNKKKTPPSHSKIRVDEQIFRIGDRTYSHFKSNIART
jgi:type IV secretory pathway VirB9-like protein